MTTGSVQDVISISLIKTANDLAKLSAETLYNSIGTPATLKSDSYMPSSGTSSVTYTAHAVKSVAK